MKTVHLIAFILLIVGGVNWGLHAIGYNLVDMLLGEGSTLSMVVYLLVAAAAVLEAFTHKNSCKHCVSESQAAPMSSQM